MPLQYLYHPSNTHQNSYLPFSAHSRHATDNMAPSANQSKDNILPISNNNFFKHRQCPMRTDNTRCRNLPTCERVDFGDHAGLEKAALLRDQILQQIRPFKNEASAPNSHVWTDIETKVDMLMKWVLCKKHVSHYSAAVQMTMRFLKQESGIFVEKQSAQEQPHSNEPARINDSSVSSGLGSGAPYSAYASAASHLTTPPMSPGTLAQEVVYHRCFASHAANSLNNGAVLDPSFKPPQQSPFAFHMNMPVKTERSVQPHNIHSQPLFNNTEPQSAVKSEPTPDTRPSGQKRVPFGFGVRKRSKTRQASGIDFAGKSRTEPTKEEPPDGRTVRERVSERAPVTQPCLSKTSNHPDSSHGKNRDSLDVTGQDDSDQSPQREVDELAERLRAAALRNEELEDRIERREDDNQMLLTANKQLLATKKYYKELYQDTKDRLDEVEGERDGLEDELDESREHIVRLEEELAMLRRPARGRSVRRRGGE